MKKKLISLVSALLIATVALTGCGSSSTEGSQSTGGSQTATESQAQTRLDKIKEAGVIVMATSPDFAPYEFENISGLIEYLFRKGLVPFFHKIKSECA